MNLDEIAVQLEDIKALLWEFCEDEKTEAQKETKKAMNYLLDCVDELVVEREQV